MRRLLWVDGRGHATTLGPLETQVMEQIWLRSGWASVTDIMPAFEAKLSYSTIKTVLGNLVEKGHLKKRTAGRANEFAARITREAFEEQVIADLVKPLIAQYRQPLLAHIVSQLDDNDGIMELEQLLKEKRSKRRDR